MKEKLAPFVLKITKYVKSYIELCLFLLVFAIVIRFFETILLYRNIHDFVSSILLNLTGLSYDISLFLCAGIWILIIFIVACFFNEKIARVLLRILLSLMLLVSLMLVLFFTTSGFLLDKVVFTYSLQEIWGIVMASSKSPVWVYIVIVVLPVLYFYLSGKRIKINRLLLMLFAVLTLSSFFISNTLTPRTAQYNVKVNKEYFFLKNLFIKQTSIDLKNNEDLIKTVTEFRGYFPELQFDDSTFPFLHQAEYKDVLSSFFNLKPEPPNLVFIIIEGLNYDNLYNDFQLMPFLDSLSTKSLTWEYCLSTSSRTFGVLPALFGAGPLGEKGFMDLCPNTPEFHSLPRILYQNRYTNNFFYGGWMEFDHMESFVKINDTKYLGNADWEEDIKNETLSFEWGYEDHLTYMQALRKLNNVKSLPRMDLYLSLSTHDPFEYPNRLHFEDILKQKLLGNNTQTKMQKEKYLKSSKLYGSFAYADWAIEQLMEGYKNRSDFENTIFIITGDHSCFVSQYAGYSNYHVPLIIYSPMLKSARKMKGVVSHRDITPTLISLLKNNYNIETPEEVAWLNTALDTSLTFNANTFSPLQLIGHSIGGILHKNYMLCEGILEELTEDGPVKINNASVLQKMNRLLILYQTLDSYILNNDALIKNEYSHKKTTNIALYIEDTIAKKSYFAVKSKLPVVKESEHSNTALYMDSATSFTEFTTFQIPQNVSLIQVDIEFKYRIKPRSESNGDVHIIVSVEKDTESSFYNSDYLTIDNEWNTYKKTIVSKKEIYASLGKDCKLVIYIWNQGKLEGYFDDIMVKISTD